MTGKATARSPWKYLAIATIATAVIAAVPVPAEAHVEGYRAQRKHIRSRARTQIGAPYRYGGASPKGFDCSGFTLWVFDGHGADLPHSSMSQFDLAGSNGYKRIWKRKNLRTGDLVFHKTTSARVGHAGIYIGRGKFISSTSSGGVQVRSIWDRYYWGPRWVGATRTPATRR